jgi:hypothetical protein
LFLQLVETLPRDKSIAIFVDSESSPSKFLGTVVAHLSRPHEVKTVLVTPTTYAGEVAAVNRIPSAQQFFARSNRRLG